MSKSFIWHFQNKGYKYSRSKKLLIFKNKEKHFKVKGVDIVIIKHSEINLKQWVWIRFSSRKHLNLSNIAVKLPDLKMSRIRIIFLAQFQQVLPESKQWEQPNHGITIKIFLAMFYITFILFLKEWLVWCLQLLSLQIYLKCVKKLYRTGLEMVNFKTASEQARQLINSWVENQTNGKVRQDFKVYFPLTAVFEQLLGRLNIRREIYPPIPSSFVDISCGKGWLYCICGSHSVF